MAMLLFRSIAIHLEQLTVVSAHKAQLIKSILYYRTFLC